VFGWLGPNGAGKTTTVRLLLDFIRPTAGTATVLGGSGADPEIRRRIGYLPGDLKLDPTYTADDVFDFYGALRGGVSPSWREALIERFELDPRRPLRTLSTGNRRKVGIVQAFLHRPELLILDEPTSGLDPLLQQTFNALVREATGWGATVFLSSHVLPEVEALASRVGILRRGRLVAVTGLDALRAQARQRLTFVVDGPPDVTAFERLDEVVELDVHGETIELVVEGSVARVLRAAAPLEVVRMSTRDDDLEDMFLTFYEDDRT
jgi:ABC-2 type transport system ATP-binding protein